MNAIVNGRNAQTPHPPISFTTYLLPSEFNSPSNNNAEQLFLNTPLRLFYRDPNAFVEIVDGNFDYPPSSSEVAYYTVNFGDPIPFRCCFNHLLAQDEQQICMHPGGFSIRKYLMSENGEGALLWNQTALIHHLLLYGLTSVYGNGLVEVTASNVEARIHRIEPPRESRILLMVGLCGCEPGAPINANQVLAILLRAYCGFSSTWVWERQNCVSGPPPRIVICTGFWGCGAYGGNKRVYVLLQYIAAMIAGVRLRFHIPVSPSSAADRQCCEWARTFINAYYSQYPNAINIQLTDFIAEYARVHRSNPELHLNWNQGNGT